jgi:KDO2-lipid IV(A) lauroyltransferase
LIADQKMNDGIPVPFFGRTAMTAPVLAVLALRFDCDGLPLRVERLDGAHFRVQFAPAIVQNWDHHGRFSDARAA